MKISASLVLTWAVLSVALPCAAQQSSSSAPAPAAGTPAAATPAANTPAPAPAVTAPAAAPSSAQTPASSSDASGPSADTIKRAKSVGMKPETHGGKTLFCWEDASLGSRFPTKKCTDDSGVEAMIAQREAAKATMRQSMTGSSAH